MLDQIRKSRVNQGPARRGVSPPAGDLIGGEVETLPARSRWAPVVTRKICSSCKAECCTVMSVVLDYEMVEGGLRRFKHEWIPPSQMVGRAFLRKRKDGSCVYFDREEKTCSIYHRRPHACKAFFCGKGTKNNQTWLFIKAKADELRQSKTECARVHKKNGYKKKPPTPALKRDEEKNDV